jgi:hypothetical protein
MKYPKLPWTRLFAFAALLETGARAHERAREPLSPAERIPVGVTTDDLRVITFRP